MLVNCIYWNTLCDSKESWLWFAFRHLLVMGFRKCACLLSCWWMHQRTVIKYLYSTSVFRGAPVSVKCFLSQGGKFFWFLRNWSKDREEGYLNDWSSWFQLDRPRVVKLVDWVFEFEVQSMQGCFLTEHQTALYFVLTMLSYSWWCSDLVITFQPIILDFRSWCCLWDCELDHLLLRDKTNCLVMASGCSVPTESQ